MSFTVAPIVAFLTRPLLAAAFPPASIAAAHLILAAALAPTPAGTLTLTARTPPPALAAACLGAKIAWPVWFAAFAGRKLTKSGGAIVVTYTPQRAEARLQPALLKPQHKRTRAVSAADTTSARLRAVLLSARQRVAAPASRTAVRRPSPLRVCSYSSDEDSDLDSASDSDSDSECGSSFDSDDCASSVSSAPTTPPASPTKPTAPSKAAPWVPAWRLRAAAADPSAFASKPKATVRPTRATTTTATPTVPRRAVAYHYTGGVTRVLPGGVMLGASARTTSRA